jgi:hypothetical protein
MFRRFRTLVLVLALAGVTIFAVSCGSSNAQLRIVQAIPDVTSGQALDIYLDGNRTATAASFGSVNPSKGYSSVSSGSRHLQVFLTGQTTGPYFDGTISLSSGSQYTVVLTGFTTSNNVAAPLFTDTNTPAPTSGNVSIRVIHASPTWNYSYYPTGMDIYVLGPGQTIVEGTQTVSALGYEHASKYVSAAANTYTVIATPPGLPAETDVLPQYAFNSGVVRTVVFVDSPGGGLGATPLVLSDLGN